MPDYADIWNRYDLAVSALYDEIGPAEERTRDIVRSPDVINRADLVITTSEQLTRTAALDLTAPRALDRERSMLRLVAGAATDLAVASDLLRTEGGEPTITTRGARDVTYSRVMSELGPILQPGDGFGVSVVTRAAAPAPETVEEALTQLTTTAGHSFDAISGDVRQLGQMVISNVVSLPAARIHEAAAVATSEIVNLMGGQISGVLSRIAQLMIRAYEKILAALGQDLASQARKQAAEWVETLQSGEALNQLLGQLYEKQRILAEIEAQGKQAEDTLLSDAFPAALEETRALTERFQKQRQSVEWVLRGLNFVRNRLLQIQPWGPLAVAATYMTTLGYVVYAGGDYVDWFRTDQIQPLNRVPGLRAVVRETLTSPQSSEEA